MILSNIYYTEVQIRQHFKPICLNIIQILYVFNIITIIIIIIIVQIQKVNTDRDNKYTLDNWKQDTGDEEWVYSS